MNNGDGTFPDAAEAEGIEPLGGGTALPETIAGRLAPCSSRCAAIADFANEGRLDMVVNNFNDRPYYFKSLFPRANRIPFCLRFGNSRRDPGSAVRAERPSPLTLILWR